MELCPRALIRVFPMSVLAADLGQVNYDIRLSTAFYLEVFRRTYGWSSSEAGKKSNGWDPSILEHRRQEGGQVRVPISSNLCLRGDTGAL